VNIRVSPEFFGLAITGPTGWRMDCFVGNIGFCIISRSIQSPIKSFVLGIGFLTSHCLRMAGECLPHEADLPTTSESTSCPPSIPGGCSLSGHSWSPSKVQCLHGFHLSTFGDLVSWNRLLQRWDWRKVNPPRLCKALQTHLPSRPVWWLISCLGKRGISPLLVSSQQRLRSRKFRTLPALPPKRRTLSRSFATASTFSFQRILLHKGPSSAAPPGYKFITAPLRPNIGSQRSLVLLTPERPSSHSSPSKGTPTLGGVTSSTLPLSSHYRKQ